MAILSLQRTFNRAWGLLLLRREDDYSTGLMHLGLFSVFICVIRCGLTGVFMLAGGFLALLFLLGRQGLLAFELFLITAIALLRGLLLLYTLNCDVGERCDDLF